MATIQQLMQALRNADAAGDTAAATRLAVIIRDAQKAGTVQPPPQPAGQQVTEDQLRHDPDWIAASRTVYAMDNSRQPDAAAQEVNKVLDAYREAAMVRLVREEVGTFQGVTDAAVLKLMQRSSSNANVPFR